MARKVIAELIDDLNGEPADRTVSFSIEGLTYEIDLTDDNAQALYSALDAFVSHARLVGGRRSRTFTASPATSRRGSGATNAKLVREWANSHGIHVNGRGRLSQGVIDQYLAANN